MNLAMKKRFILFSFLLSSYFLNAQRTVGLVQINENEIEEGYTLLASLGTDEIYLINNCGESVHQWQSTARPGAVTYLLENGNILRTERLIGAFSGGGLGGKIKLINWDSEVLWDYTYADENVHQHHDVEALPNGNILIIAWERIAAQDMYDKGRVNGTIDEDIWLPQITEVEPEGLTGGNIIWQWRAFDHLCQDNSEVFPNFGVATHPELIDINYNSGNAGAPGPEDWVHLNAIDYNPELDQIILSSRSFDELWIIDHSTTTAEAASHTGGNSDKGGDLLFRWGNPQTYKRGTINDRVFFAQHDVQWIAEDLPGAGQIILFNNGQGRAGGNYSSIDILEAPLDTDGYNYTINAEMPYNPAELIWSYGESSGEEFFYSQNISGVQRLPNGNTLICEGRGGRIFEINTDREIVWEYISPIQTNDFIEQGTSADNNSMFRAYRYPADYPAFEGKDLSSGQFLEINPLASLCVTSDINQVLNTELIEIFPNPTQGMFQIIGQPFNSSLRVYNILGQEVYEQDKLGERIQLNLSHLPRGSYFLKINEHLARKLVIE